MLSLINLSEIASLPPCAILYLILVCFFKNRKTYYGAKGWYELLHRLDLSFVDDQFAKYYQRRPRYLRRIVLFLFLCWLFEITHTQLLLFLNNQKDRFWFRFLPVHDRFLKLVSEFLGTSGQNVEVEEVRHCFFKIVSQIFSIVRVEQLTDDDLLGYCRYFTFRRPSSLDIPADATGRDYFANFLFSLGIAAALALCQKKKEEKRLLTGFGYSVPQLVKAIFTTLGEKSIASLAKELRNTFDAEDGLSPSAQVLRQFVKDFHKDKVVTLYESCVKTFRKWNPTEKIIVAIDATVLEVFGDYEQAEWLWDHNKKQYVKGYKLYLIFDVTNAVPIGYLLATKEAECLKLLPLVQKAKEIVGAEQIQFTVFDRGYFDTSQFARMDDYNLKFVTLGKKCKTPVTIW